MKRIILLAALSIWAGAALADQCTIDMKAIDEVLARKLPIDAATLARVKRLRSQGEAFHNADRHADGRAKLEEAKELIQGAGAGGARR